MKGIITISFKKIVTASNTIGWEKAIFDATYLEFKMQAQYFDKQNKFETFREILNKNPKADQIHYLASTAAFHHIRQLNNIIPEVLNGNGDPFLPFENFRFEVVDSHVNNKNLHAIAIYFYSKPVTWVDTISNGLLLTLTNIDQAPSDSPSFATEILVLNNQINICNYQPIERLYPIVHHN